MRVMAVVLATLLVGCAARRGRAEVEASMARALDAAWAARRPDFLGVMAAFDALSAEHTEPVVAWRRVRAEVARAATLAPDEGLVVLDGARVAGLRCLGGGDADAGVARLKRGGVVDPSCATWTAVAWCRWAVRFGPRGAAIDRDVIDRLRSAAPLDPPFGPVAHALCGVAVGDAGAESLVELARAPATARLEGGDDRWMLWEDALAAHGAAPVPAGWRTEIRALPIPRTPEARATAVRVNQAVEIR